MVGIAVGGVFVDKVVDNKCELDEMCVVFPQTGNNMALLIPGCIEAVFQEVVYKTASLRKAIHAMNALNVYPSIRCGFLVELIIVNDSSGMSLSLGLANLGCLRGVMR